MLISNTLTRGSALTIGPLTLPSSGHFSELGKSGCTFTHLEDAFIQSDFQEKALQSYKGNWAKTLDTLYTFVHSFRRRLYPKRLQRESVTKYIGH